ncbi:RNA-binding protein [Halodesulfurarchaeum formicicum]|uniref:Probable ribonuclease FAU-1 n=1 Tax=Halodesulfurarchaeum formicicum TaxID=1873524 RepID=A0A1D8S5Y3_9EURY|nr:DUF402 domain-containing protein [Halodesulfurarchaeum formicicum]AOW80770.1 RNA-binding protein [Halodesulfurarchaeum formicicum]
MTDGEDTPAVRVRGIYATALTELLRESGAAQVVDPSPAIAARFDGGFPAAAPVATVDMTADRLGVSISGAPTATETVADQLAAVAIDTFDWTDPAPASAIFEGEVTETAGRGLIVDLDGTEGYLPNRATNDDLDVGESVRVQVQEPAPPWRDSRPRLGTTLRSPGGLATLVRGVDALVADTPDGSADHELARTTELLPVSIPENWGVEWASGAAEAEMATLEAALQRAVEHAREIESALDGATGPIARPQATNWLRFGRETRFALDEYRSAVTETIPGHHRIKAGGEDAGTAVDFVESLGQAIETFPFGPVTDALGPAVEESVRIVHSKPDGQEFALGRGTVTDRSTEKERVTVERELTSAGTYDALGTAREPGDTATTRFAEGRWWYPTVYRGTDGTPKGTYVNIATPVEVFPDAVRYVDLYIDVIKKPDGTVEIVDAAELEAAVQNGHVPEAVAERATDVAERVKTVLSG